jgi:uncharacterized membrane protein
MKFLMQKWNDTLSLLIIVGVPGVIVSFGERVPEVALGAFIAGWTLTVQYYFRKKDTPVS